MGLDGRTEKRIMKAVPVSLAVAEELPIAEQVLTVNVSRHGARLNTKRKWKPGERPRVAKGRSQAPIEAKVVYCEPLAEGRFCVGLEIRPGHMDWGAESE
jgi:hypothetical protein